MFEINIDKSQHQSISIYICNAITPRIQVGAVREALEFLYSSFQQSNLSTSPQINLYEGKKTWTIGNNLEKTPHQVIQCEITGRSDAKIELKFPIKPIRFPIYISMYCLLLLITFLSIKSLGRLKHVLQLSSAQLFEDLLSERLKIQRKSNSDHLFLNKIRRFLKMDSMEIISKIEDRINHLEELISNQSKVLSDAKSKERLTQLSIQVAHDIRSPLTALETATHIRSSKPDDSNLLIKSAISRIRSIANDLLFQSKPLIDKTDLMQSIKSIILEKKLEFSCYDDLRIDFSAEEDKSYLALLNADELKRVLSNLINNSVEAMTGNGRIIIDLNEKNNLINLSITDSGPGIKTDLLPKLTVQGASFGKESGLGLGLYHAKTTIELWQGTFLIESEEGHGTQITIRLPKAESSPR